jgi:lysozyme
LKYCNTFNRTRTAALLKARSEKEKEEELQATKQMMKQTREAEALVTKKATTPPRMTLPMLALRGESCDGGGGGGGSGWVSGLANEVGRNACFINVIVHCLHDCEPLRSLVAGATHAPSAAPIHVTLLCELQAAFAALSATERQTGIIEIDGIGIAWRRGLSRDQADQLLTQDLARFEDAVESLDVRLEQHRFDALVSFAFNVGVGAFISSTLARHVKRKDFVSIPSQLRRGTVAGGKLIKGRVKRREAEAALFGTGDYTGQP